MRKVNQLTPLKIAQLSKSGRYADGLGLYLEVSPRGNKSWCLRYMIDGRARQHGLGPLHTVTLQDAREKARVKRLAILDGNDPIDAHHEAMNARKAEALRNITFRHALTDFLTIAQDSGIQKRQAPLAMAHDAGVCSPRVGQPPAPRNHA